MKFKGLLAVLVCLAAVLLFFSNRTSDKIGVAGKMQQQLRSQLLNDSAILQRYFNSEDDRTMLSALSTSPYLIEVFHQDSIIFWNEQTLSGNDPSKDFADLLRVGDKINYATLKLNVRSFDACLVLPVETCKQVKLTAVPAPQQSDIINLNNHYFTVEFENVPRHPAIKGLAWLCLFSCFILFSVFCYRLIKSGLKTAKSVKLTLISLFLGVIFFRGIHYLPAFTALFNGFEGFKTLDTGSYVADHIAGLMISIWIFGLMIYLIYLFLPKINTSIRYTNTMAVFTGMYTFFIFGACARLLDNIILMPDVNLEIEALLEFNAVSFVLIICFIVLMILIFQSTHMLFEMLYHAPLRGIQKYSWIATGWALGLFLLFSLGWLNVPVWILTVFVVSYSLILDAYSETREKKITYLIWWLIMFAAYLAVSMFYFGLQKDIADRTQFITAYFSSPEDKAVKEMQLLSDQLVAGDVFSRIASLDMPAKLDMKDLYQFIFNRSDDDPKFSIELFDKKTGNTLFNNHFADYYKLNQSFENSRKVGRNIVHNPFENKYISRFEIARSVPGNSSWYLFIILQDQQQTTFDSKRRMPDFGFAVFNRERMIEKSEGTQASPDMALLQSVMATAIKNGYSFVVSVPSDQYRIISWKKVSGLIKPISLFSFIFTLSGLIILLLTFINTRYNFLPAGISLKFGSRSSLKTKIQLAIILLILVTFLIIGAITGFYFKNLIEANQKTKHREETTSIINNIRSDIQNMADDESALSYLNSKLKDLSFVHNKSLSLYDYAGKLVGSTGRENNLIRVPFNVWNASLVDKEKWLLPDSQTFSDTEYMPLYLSENNPFAFIAIDHKSYNSSGNILDFLSTILNAYIFLFLIAGAIAITIANSITQPLSILAEKLKKFKLGKSNELLDWNSNDEIGTLIHDYNNLTQELEKSAGLLAKTERDMAWREMAKQVAHEIKNPLTPMKLSIQYLDRAAKDHPEKAQDLIPRISSTLIEQIDNLSQIANEFSNFASMPQASNEKIILNEIVETIHDLFRKRDDMDINMIEPIDDLYVFADKNHLVRILNNLLKNAIQAIPDNRRGKIEIELKRQGNDALIRISDNGSGIPDHMKEKVFTPNFTTKSSGTGLGLAISANMIESFNGRIYFETRVGEGTDFYISIPLMRLDDYFGEESRVSLD